MKHGTVIAVFILSLVISCSQQQKRVKVTYISDPPGGTLHHQSGELRGPCPKVLWYDIDKDALAAGLLDARGMTVRWPSGPEKKSDKLIWIPVDGSDHKYTFVQPKDEANATDERGDVVIQAETTDPNDGVIIEEELVVTQVESERDPGLREEQDEESVQIADAANTIKPTDIAEVWAEQGQQQRQQREKETVQVKATFKTVDFTNGMTMEFALIPAGEFIVDDPSDEGAKDSNAAPTHRIRISKPFYMSVYEVTQEQYKKVMGTNPSRFEGPRRPVDTVSWRDAQMFCQKLSSIDGGRYRLATEAEWEYACRAGTTTAYYWGDDFDSRYGWTISNSEATTHEVGARLPNAWGLRDMAGNVAEWCQDWYEKYDSSSPVQVDPKGPSEGVYRILRGGSWGHTPASCRSAYRKWQTPEHKYDDCGIRVVLELE